MTGNNYKPEGVDKDTKKHCLESLREALNTGEILEGKVVRCDARLNLMVDLGNGLFGKIPYGESELSKSKDIKKISVISKVGKTVCFKVLNIDDSNVRRIKVTLSRKAAQEEYQREILDNMRCGDVITAKVINAEKFGVFIDIGCGIVSLLACENISISRVKDARKAFKPGDLIKVVILDIADGRIAVTYKELLGTWRENIEKYGFEAGETVVGQVRRVTPYGIFVELSANLSGLAEVREGIQEGDNVTVYIKSIVPERLKVKLSIIDKSEYDYQREACEYFIKEDHIDSWVYSPDEADKKVETIFNRVQE